MAKLFKFSGYYLDRDEEFGRGSFQCELSTGLNERNFRQLCIDESHYFDITVEDKNDCSVEELNVHFVSGHEHFDRALPEPGQKWRHFKNGTVVEIICIAGHSETGEVEVVYKHEDSIWCRPLSMFMSKVDKEKYPYAEQEYRLELIDE